MSWTAVPKKEEGYPAINEHVLGLYRNNGDWKPAVLIYAGENRWLTSFWGLGGERFGTASAPDYWIRLPKE